MSLHAPNDELRNELVPINRKHPIAELLEACWHYIDEQNGRSVTFEYVMLDGVNDSPAQARELARLLQGQAGEDEPDSVQSVPGHAVPPLAADGDPALPRRADAARSASPPSARTRGDDIDAACGQLAGQVIDRTTVRLGSKTFGLQVRA